MTNGTVRVPAALAKAVLAGADHGYRGWVDTADAAKLIRAALKARWPATKFYVRMDRFAGGSSIDVYYDGVDPKVWTRVDYDGNPYGDPIDYATWSPSDGRIANMPRPGAPRRRDVDALVKTFGGADFDGSIDMSFSHDAWLTPDGRLGYGGTRGTADSRGYVPASTGADRPASAVTIHVGAYLHVSNSLPYTTRKGRLWLAS